MPRNALSAALATCCILFNQLLLERMITTVGQLGYVAAFAGYILLALIYIVRGRWGSQGHVFLIAALLTAAWAGVALETPWNTALPHVADLLHHAASLTWILFLWLLLSLSAELRNNYPRRIRLGWVVIAGLVALVIGFDLVRLLYRTGAYEPAIAPALLASIAGLSLTEAVLRSFRRGDRWSVKYLCLAAAGMFAYDIFYFSDALLYRTMDDTLRGVRGYVVALLVPFLIVNIFRAEARHLALSLSSQMVFGSTVLIGTGFYLGIMAVSAYYIRDYGGTWSQALQVIFIFVAILLLCVALLSGTLRSYLRRFIAEHFQKQKFDYRREWRRLLQQISAGDSEEPLDLRVVKTLADLLDSPAGALWYLEAGSFSIATTWNILVPSITGSNAVGLTDLFKGGETVIDLQWPANSRPSARPALPSGLSELDKARFLLPLFHHDG